MKIVGTDAPEVGRALLAGELSCPSCAERLRPWVGPEWAWCATVGPKSAVVLNGLAALEVNRPTCC